MAVAGEAPALRCPSCDRPLARGGDRLRCTDCGETVPVVDGVPRFPVAVERSDLASFFDRLSPVYETPLWFPVVYRVTGGPFAPPDDRATVADSLDAAGGDVLDVACGTGRFTRYVADEAAFVWGIDASEGMLRRARRYAGRDGTGNVGFARMAADDLRFGDDGFDAVACCWALHLFPDVAAALTEIGRVLKPGGRLAGTTLTDGYGLGQPCVREGLRHAVGAHVFDAGDLRSRLREAGFGPVEFERFGAALFFGAVR